MTAPPKPPTWVAGPTSADEAATGRRAAKAIAAEVRSHAGLILESLRHTRRAFMSTAYPSPEFKDARVAEVDEAISAVIALRNAGSESEGETR